MARPQTANTFALKGLGLGFPVDVAHARSASAPLRRTISVGSHLADSPDSSFTTADEDLDFPLPPQAERQSYWSPDTNASASPAFSSPSSPRTPALVAHPALHLLSPKAQTMGRAAALFGVDDAVDGALDFGWLVSAIDDGAAPASHVAVPRVRMASRALVLSPQASSTSMSTTSSSSATATSSIFAPSLHRMASHASTAASSLFSSPPSLGKPSTSSPTALRYFGSVPDLRRPASSALLGPRRGSTMATLEEQVTCDPRSTLLKIWLDAEAAERERPLPALPVEGRATKVKAWLGRLRAKGKAGRREVQLDEVREPRVRRTRSIDEVLAEA